MDEAEPTAVFERLLGDAPAVLAAVSGGPDSLALLAMLADWVGSGGKPTLFAATVDHGLRPEAAAEAALAAQTAAALGVPHATLRWKGPKPGAGLQEAAREARYRLLAAHAHGLGATHLATAHHADDQAETVLMRLAAGSGVAGLAGMREATERHGLRLVRPLLGLRKAELIAYCRARGLVFSEDPSNADDRFARARLRRMAPLLAAEGLTPERLLTLARRAGEAEEALAAAADGALRRMLLARSDCLLRLDWRVARQEPRAIRLRVLAKALEAVPGPVPALEKLEDLEAVLSHAEGRLKRTLADRLVTLMTGGVLTIGAAPQRRENQACD